MKFMTLNTHSWLEPEPEKKLQELADKILLEDYEVIALQEINQLLESEDRLPISKERRLSDTQDLDWENKDR